MIILCTTRVTFIIIGTSIRTVTIRITSANKLDDRLLSHSTRSLKWNCFLSRDFLFT